MLTQPQEKYREVLQAAETLWRQEPDWVTFFRKIVGVEGAIRQGFPSFDELTAFEQSEEYEKIQKMLVKLRERKTAADPENEPTRVITVRLPKSMHEYLRTEAHDLRTSMNKLCISKLLQVIDEGMIPNERTAGTGKKHASMAAPAQPLAMSTPIHTTTPINTSPTATLSQPAARPALQPVAQPQQQAPSPFKPSQPRF
ncbi:MAG: hypothetical protein GXP28_02515 [Planctomycetes bacterium]|nr:hypothetical protein [Planctomycetota bacterium]